MMLCYSNTTKIKYFLDPPPKKRLKDTNGCDMSTRTSVFLYNQPVTWIFTRSNTTNTTKIKYFLDPPPKKKAQGYEWLRYVYTHKCFSIQSARDLDIH